MSDLELVGQNIASWNQLAGWLREIAALREAAWVCKPHHGFKSGARNEQCRPTCTWWPDEANRVVLLGISLGGVFAPALAREKAVRGIVVFGTLATRPPAYPGRSERFFTEFDAVDVPAAWAAIDTRLLMRRGPGDLGIERRGPGFPADARLSSIVRRFLLCVVSASRRT